MTWSRVLRSLGGELRAMVDVLARGVSRSEVRRAVLVAEELDLVEPSRFVVLRLRGVTMFSTSGVSRGVGALVEPAADRDSVPAWLRVATIAFREGFRGAVVAGSALSLPRKTLAT